MWNAFWNVIGQSLVNAPRLSRLTGDSRAANRQSRRTSVPIQSSRDRQGSVSIRHTTRHDRAWHRTSSWHRATSNCRQTTSEWRQMKSATPGATRCQGNSNALSWRPSFTHAINVTCATRFRFTAAQHSLINRFSSQALELYWFSPERDWLYYFFPRDAMPVPYIKWLYKLMINDLNFDTCYAKYVDDTTFFCLY